MDKKYIAVIAFTFRDFEEYLCNHGVNLEKNTLFKPVFKLNDVRGVEFLAVFETRRAYELEDYASLRAIAWARIR